MKNFGVLDPTIYKYIISWQSLLIALGLWHISGGVRKNWFETLILITIGSVFLFEKIYGADFGIKNLILGADCTLPTGIEIDNIRAAVEATGTYQP